MSSTVNPDVSSPMLLDDDPVNPNLSSKHGEDEADLGSKPEVEEEDESSDPEEEEEDESDGSSNYDDDMEKKAEKYRAAYKPASPDKRTFFPKELRTKLRFFSGSHVSIESIELKIKAGDGDGDGDSRIREIYGKIMVTGRRGKVYAVYHREEDKPDLIPEGEPYPLKLSGPKYALSTTNTEFLHLRLFEKGVDIPFIKGDLFFEKKGHRWAMNHELIQMHFHEDWVDLTVNFTRFGYSMPARVSLLPITKDPHAQWTVSGTVKAKQSRALPNNNGSFERTITLFEGKGVLVSSGDVIPLDRSVVVAPLESKDMKGRPGSLTIELDLEFGENDMVSQLNGHKIFVCKEDSAWGEQFSGDIILKRPHSPTKDDPPTNGGPDRIEVVVTHFHDFDCDLSDEEDEGDYFELIAPLLE